MQEMAWHSGPQWSHEDREAHFWQAMSSGDYFKFGGDEMRRSTLERTPNAVIHEFDDMLFKNAIETLTADNDYTRLTIQLFARFFEENEVEDLISRYKTSGDYQPRTIAFLDLLERESHKPRENVILYFDLFRILDYMLLLLYDLHLTSQNFTGYYIPINSRVFKYLMKYKNQYNPALLNRCWQHQLDEYHGLTNAVRQRLEIQRYIIHSVHILITRSKIQDLDTRRAERNTDNQWHFTDCMTQEMINFAKGAVPTQIDNSERSYIKLLNQQIKAYTQLPLPPSDIANYIWEDCVIPDPSILKTMKEEGDKNYMEDIVDMLYTIHRQMRQPFQKLVYRFVWHAILIASDMVQSIDKIQIEWFITRRLAEIIRGNQHLNQTEFTRYLHFELNNIEKIHPYLYNGPSNQFKTNIIFTLKKAFQQLFTAAHATDPHQQGVRPSAYEPEPDYHEPANQPEHHPHSNKFQETEEINDFLTNTSLPSAVNRYEGGDLENSNQHVPQTPYFKVKSPIEAEDEMDKELVYAAKRNAQNEYYKQMAINAVEGQKTGLLDNLVITSKPFNTAEETLSQIRGNIMRKYITSNTATIDQDLTPTRLNDYENLTIELGAFLHSDDSTFIPLTKSPIRTVLEYQGRDDDIFHDLTNIQDLQHVANVISRASGSMRIDWTKSELTRDVKIGIEEEFDPHTVVIALSDFISEKVNKRENYDIRENKLTLGANAQQWDNSAQTTVKFNDWDMFYFNALLDRHTNRKKFELTASFQTTLNIPKFCHREIFQSAHTLKKTNMDFHKHLNRSLLNYIDLKVRFMTPSGHKIELVWTISRFKHDHYHLVHMAYQSKRPDHTLLTPPINLSNITQTKNESVDGTVKVCQHTIKSEKLYKADEMKLMQIHAQGVRTCTSKNYEQTPDQKPFGFIYTYTFWTLIGTCFRIGEAHNNEFLTCYTVIHRTSDLTKPFQRKRVRDWDSSSQGTTQTQPSETIYVNQPRIRFIREKRGLPKGNNWYVFGIVGNLNEEMYIFIQTTSEESRKEYDHMTRRFQTKVYQLFYPDTIKKSEQLRQPLTEYISHRLTSELGTAQITPVPGLFSLWMKKHPKGERPNENEPINGYSTAEKYWTHLWDVYIQEKRIYIFKSNLHKDVPDQYLEAFIKQHEKKKGQQQPQRGHPPQHGGFRGRGRGRRGGIRSQFHGRSTDHWLEHEESVHEEDPTQISQMQHEIDTLRRSLNQLALLQG